MAIFQRLLVFVLLISCSAAKEMNSSEVSASGSMSSGGQQSASVTFNGASADYIFQNFDRESGIFANCFRASMKDRPEQEVQCTAFITIAEIPEPGKIYISGASAVSLYEHVDPAKFEESQISCFRETLNTGANRVACELKGTIVETFGIDIQQ